MDPSKTMACPECGNVVAVTDQFCSKCFARLEPPGLWRKFLSLFRSAARPGPHVVNLRKTETFQTVNRGGERHVYHSLDELPPELRAEMERLKAETLKEAGGAVMESSPAGNAMTPNLITTDKISEYRVRDASGNEQVYHSLDEMPPELRAEMEKLQSQKPGPAESSFSVMKIAETDKTFKAGGVSTRNVSLFKYKDASGQEHTCHSVDELPPAIRDALKRAGIKLD